MLEGENGETNMPSNLDSGCREYGDIGHRLGVLFRFEAIGPTPDQFVPRLMI